MSDTRNDTQRNHLRPPQQKRRRGTTPEAKVTAACDKYLQSIGALIIRANAGSWSDDQGNIIMGAKAGTSDKVLCLPGGHFAALELKAGRNTLTDAQRAYKARVESLGGCFIEAHSVDDLRAGLVAAYGEPCVLAWETAGHNREQVKQARRRALMQKMGQR